MADRVTLEYIPIDRTLALAQGTSLPDPATGAALFADISGFTPLTEALVTMFGARRGAEELSSQLNRVYDALVAEVHRYRGSVISFSGDAITCWFDDPLRAVTCALAMQTAMLAFSAITLPNGETRTLTMKAAVATGQARRFQVGDPAIQLMDALAGDTIVRMAEAEHQAKSGEVIVDAPTVEALQLEPTDWRTDEESGHRFALVTSLSAPAAPSPWPEVDAAALPDEVVRAWLLPAVFQRLQAGLGEFLTELRPALVFFIRFEGIDYENEADAQDKLDRFIRWVQRSVNRYEGAVLQLTIGDKGSYLYGSFGAPVAHEDEDWRAATALLELRTLPADLSYLRPLQIGLTRGVLRTGAYGGADRRTYGVLGDDVNLSARLMQNAAPGDILASEAVQQAVSTRFVWEGMPPLRVKGKSEPVRVFRLSGTGEARGIRLQEPVYGLPMIGRAAELAQVVEKLDLALQGHGQIVGIAAEAGMGKSRLVAEFIRLARARGVLGYGSDCHSYGTNISYLVWKPLMRGFFGLHAGDPLDVQVAALERELRRMDEALPPRLPLLGIVLDLDIPDNDFTRDLEPQVRRSSLEALMLECLRLRAEEARKNGTAMFLVLEDLHWIDPASHDFLEVLGRASVDWPMLVVLAYRPVEPFGPLAPRVEGMPNFTRINLSELSQEELGRLVQVKLEQLDEDAIPASLVARVLERAEGNPFYIEELLNYIHDRGLTVSDIETMELPQSLHSLILSRIDQLTERQKITLKVASIIGRMFHLVRLYGYYPALGELEQIKTDLSYLSDIELTPLDQPEPEIIYLFKHILTQEVAYESLPYSTRATLHEQFGAYLEGVPDITRSLDLIAYHYGRSDNLPKKREYFRRAGEAAANRFANVEAIEYLSRAIEVAPADDLAARYELYRLRERVYNVQAAREPQIQDITTLEGLAERLDDNRRRAEVALRRAVYSKGLGQYADAIQSVQRTIALASSSGAVESEAEAYMEWGQALWFEGEYPTAKAQLEQALSRATNLLRLRSHVLRNLAMVAIRQGDFDGARAYYEQALPLFRENADRMGEGVALSDLGNIAFFEGDFAGAQRYYQQAIQLGRDIGDRWGVCSTLNNLGAVVADESGDYARAQGYLQEALTLARLIGDPQVESSSLNNLGFYAAALGNYAAAQSSYEQALQRARESDNQAEEVALLNNLGVVAASQGDYETARRYYDESLTLKREAGDQVGESETLAFLGLLHHELGDHETARANCQQALEIAHDAGVGLEEARALNFMGHALVALGRLDEAADAYRQSLERRRELGQEHAAVEPQAGLAAVALAQGFPENAQTQVNEILAHFEERSADGLEEPFRVYLTCYRVLAGDARARSVLETAHTLLQERAAKTAGPALRQSYLERVPAHREIVAAWAAG